MPRALHDRSQTIEPDETSLSPPVQKTLTSEPNGIDKKCDLPYGHGLR